MKLRNLFLASLAAMTIVSCSNEVEGIENNGGEVAKNAKMQLGIAFPAVTRADATNPGELYEQKINDLTVVVVNGNAKTVKYYLASELVNGEEESAKINMTPTFEVSAGTVTVYAYVNYGNGDDKITEDNYTSYEESATYKALSIDNNVASVDNENFHMNGYTEGVIISPNVTNYAKVEISRVAAKITEATITKSYTHSDLAYGADLTIELTDYSLINFNQKVNVLADNATDLTEADFYNYYAGDSNTEYLDLFTEKMPHADINAENKDSYLLANQSSTTTGVVYKAKASFAGENVTDQDGTFYIRNNKDGVPTVYSLTKLKETYPGVYNSCNEDTSIKEWSSLGVKKYAQGVCYYRQEIKTTAGDGQIAQILRNNLYSLNVTAIKDLGTPELDTPDPQALTLLEVEVIIKAWTFNLNNIIL